MKRYPLYLIAFGFAAITLISATAHFEGSPGGKTGSPLDGNSCTQCHVGTATSVNWISTNIPESGYLAREVYVITAEATGASTTIGFELTAENIDAKQGTFTLAEPGRTRLVNDGKAVTQNWAGVSATGGKNTWTMNWTAPTSGTGKVTLYAAFNVSNADASSSGDTIYTSALSIEENVSSAVSDLQSEFLRIFPNPGRGEFSIASNQFIQQVNVYNLQGKLVKQITGSQATTLELNLKGSEKGTYLIKIATDSGEIIRKVQIQ